MPGNGQALTRRRRKNNGPQLLRVAANRELLIILEHRIELEGVCYTLTGQADNQPTALGCLDLVGFKEMAEQNSVIVKAHPVEVGQRKHALGKLRRSKLSAACQRRHGLVVQQAVGQTVQARGLDPFFLHVNLHKSDALKKLPGNGVGHERAGLRLVLSHHKPHFRWQIASAGSSHTLKERRNGKGRIHLKGAFKPADVDAELQGCRSDRG